MTFNNNSDFYIAINENGINRCINRAMLYMPSFFNFGSSYISANLQLACKTINADSSVTANGKLSTINFQLPPKFHLPPPDFIAQFPELQVDLYPNTITLPGAFPPIAAQQLALHAKTSVGLICPSKEDSRELDCFSLDLFAELGLKKPSTTKFLNIYFAALDVVGIEPNELRNILDCYLMYLANQVMDSLSDKINAKISQPLVPPVKGIVSLEISPTTIQNNPAVEDNQVKLFMNLVSLILNEVIVIKLSGTNSPGSGFAPATSKTQRARQPGSETNDLIVAISQASFSEILSKAMLNKGITVNIEGQFEVDSSIHIDYSASAFLNSGSISLQNDGMIQVEDLVTSWDHLKFIINIDLPKISIGNIPSHVEWEGIHTHIVSQGVIELFGGNPDISIPIDLSGLLSSEVSAQLKPQIFYGFGDPSIHNCPNRWQLYIVPQLPIFASPIQLSEKLTSTIKSEIDNFFTDKVFKGKSGEIVDLIKNAFSNLVVSSINVFNNRDDFTNFIVNKIINELKLTDRLDNLLSNYFEEKAPILEVQDPFPFSFKNPWGPGSTTQIPIGPAKIDIPIPISYIGLSINSNEMILEGDLG